MTLTAYFLRKRNVHRSFGEVNNPMEPRRAKHGGVEGFGIP